MKALVIEPFPTTKGIIPAGQIIEIPLLLLEKLKGKIEPIPSPQASEAWLTETGELRTRGVIDDLAAVIVGLTANNLPLQRELLVRHCEAYDRHHIEHIWDCGRNAPPSWNMIAARPDMMLNTRLRNVCTCWRSWISALTRGAETEGATLFTAGSVSTVRHEQILPVFVPPPQSPRCVSMRGHSAGTAPEHVCRD